MDKPKEKLISIHEAAAKLHIGASSIFRRGLGTENLTHIRPGGGRRILLIESEVDQLIETWIARAKEQSPAAAVVRRFGR
jgi:predicted DNA-binding transcriptional regulator AlpA